MASYGAFSYLIPGNTTACIDPNCAAWMQLEVMSHGSTGIQRPLQTVDHLLPQVFYRYVRTKTALCRYFEGAISCPYGSKDSSLCKFAHGIADLGPKYEAVYNYAPRAAVPGAASRPSLPVSHVNHPFSTYPKQHTMPSAPTPIPGVGIANSYRIAARPKSVAQRMHSAARRGFLQPQAEAKTAAEPQKPSCHQWKRGPCMRGDSCRYAHMVREPSKAVPAAPSQPSASRVAQLLVPRVQLPLPGAPPAALAQPAIAQTKVKSWADECSPIERSPIHTRKPLKLVIPE